MLCATYSIVCGIDGVMYVCSDSDDSDFQVWTQAILL